MADCKCDKLKELEQEVAKFKSNSDYWEKSYYEAKEGEEKNLWLGKFNDQCEKESIESAAIHADQYLTEFKKRWRKDENSK